jgi:feruloyl esterase
MRRAGVYPAGNDDPDHRAAGFCQVNLVQTDLAGNQVNIVVWLPAKWNENFQGVGGAGYSCGIFYTAPGVAGSLAEGVQNRYPTASTDCGVPISQDATGSWALKADGTLNWPLITDFATAGMRTPGARGR